MIGQIEPVYTTINTRNSKFIGFHKNAASVTIISRININIKQKNIAWNVYSKNEDLIRVSKKKKDKFHRKEKSDIRNQIRFDLKY